PPEQLHPAYSSPVLSSPPSFSPTARLSRLSTIPQTALCTRGRRKGTFSNKLKLFHRVLPQLDGLPARRARRIVSSVPPLRSGATNAMSRSVRRQRSGQFACRSNQAGENARRARK